MKKIFILLSFLLIVQTLNAQSLLWKVSGKGLKKSSYLYGTIHIQDKRVFAYDSIVEQTILACDAYAMEILMDELDKETIEKTMLMADEKTLKDIMSEEDYEFLDEYCKENLGQSAFFFNRMKPFFVSSQLMQVNMAKDMKDPLDMHFLNIARKAGKQCYGVEKFEDQIAAIDQISLDEQVEMMMSALRDTAGSESVSELQFDDLLKTYLNMEIEKMPELSADTSMPEKFNQAFLIDRNVGMAKNAAKLFKKQSTFVAVGAAHLGGPDGVIALLRKKGYSVEPVMFKFNNL